MSDSLTSVGDNVTTSSSFIERSSNNSITVSFPSGVGITINYTAGLLVYILEVPSSFEGTTSGLLGKANNYKLLVSRPGETKKSMRAGGYYYYCLEYYYCTIQH